MLRMRQGREKLGNWPDWCWAPLAAAVAVVSRGTPDPEQARMGAWDAPAVAALAAWRATQGMYRFSPALWDALSRTEIGTLPGGVLERLPEWCVALDLRETSFRYGDQKPDYCLAHLEWDVPTHKAELRMLFLLENDFATEIVHLEGSLSDGIRAAYDTALKNLPLARPDMLPADSPQAAADILLDMRNEAEKKAQEITPIVSALLYLCSDEPDIAGRKPEDRPTRTGWERTLPSGKLEYGPTSPRVWEVGREVSRKITAAMQQPDTQEGGVRLHVRRAHWHLYWTGRGRKDPRIRWLWPTLVGGAK